MDLSLPRDIPEMAPYRDEPMELFPFAVYKMIDLDEDDTADLLKACTQDLPAGLQDSFRYPPQASWQGKSLLSVAQYHIDLYRERQFDLFYFVAAISKDWRKDGVLVVALDISDNDDEPSGSDTATMLAQDAGTNLINLQVANVEWYEIKSSFMTNEHENQPGAASYDQPEETGNFPAAGVQSELGFRDDAPNKRPPAGFYIGIYVGHGIDFEDILRQIQPSYTQQPREDFICRFEGQLPLGSDLLEEACKLHPLRCMANKYLAKKVLIIADSQDVEKDGVLFGSMGWDGVVADKSVAEVAKIWERATLSSRRLICQTLMVVPDFCDIASGRMSLDGRRR